MIRRIISTVCLFTIFCLIGNAEPVSLDKATAIAKGVMTANKSSHKEKLVLYERVNSRKAPSRGNAMSAPAYYIFANGDDGGFVIVSGDDVASPILGYSESGTLNLDEDLPSNMQEWLDGMEEQIACAREQGEEQSDEIAGQWRAASVGTTKVQLQTAQWNQSAPFYNQCPSVNGTRCVTGCVPTAYAILMKYYGFPTSGRGKTEAYVGKKNKVSVAARNLEHTYQWSKMPLEYVSGKYSSEQASCVAQLMADIGAAINADYSTSGTSASSGNKEIFVHFGFYQGDRKAKSDYSTNDWYNLLKTELNKSRPILYRGQNANDEAHAFILYGYTDQNYFYINWGWGGSYNGTFLLNALVPASTYNFNYEQSAYINCVPANKLPCVATVNNSIQCPTWETAVAMAQDNTSTSIKMEADIELKSSQTFAENKDITLDLNGHTIEFSNYGFYNYGNLKITDSKGTGKILMQHSNGSIINNYATLVINGGSFINEVEKPDSTDYRRCVWSANGSNTSITNGNFSSGNQVLCLGGKATIDGGEFNAIDNGRTIHFYSTSDELEIKGGVFNANSSYCLYTSKNTIVKISNGTFTSNYRTLYLYGTATISGGNFTTTGNTSLIFNYNTNGVLTISGGTFKNLGAKPEGTDYRRLVTSSAGSNTHIIKGDFSSEYQMMFFSGDSKIDGGTFSAKNWVMYSIGTATITGGDFTTSGNICIIENRDTTGVLSISGGTFKNVGAKPEGTDYRRCVWSTQKTKTNISGGIFTCESESHTLCFNGIANISGGEIENKGTGYVCYAGSTMTITDCKMSSQGKSLIYKTANGSISCSGGLYSHNLERDYLQEGYSCIRNFDETTMDKYPYIVTLYDGIMGDANEDGFVSVADVTALISYVLEDNGCYINEKLADMDGDGSLGISDVDILINLILGKSN